MESAEFGGKRRKEVASVAWDRDVLAVLRAQAHLRGVSVSRIVNDTMRRSLRRHLREVAA